MIVFARAAPDLQGHLHFYLVDSEIRNVKQSIDLQEMSNELQPQNGTAEDKATESQHKDEAPKESQHVSDGIKENDREPQHKNEFPKAQVKEPEEAIDKSIAVDEKAEYDKHSEAEEENGSDSDLKSDSKDYSTEPLDGTSEPRSNVSETGGEVSKSQLISNNPSTLEILLKNTFLKLVHLFTGHSWAIKSQNCTKCLL